MARIEQKRTGWLEPMAEWIKEAGNLPKIARESNLFAKKVAAKEIFGSNLVLAGREARLTAPSGEDLSGGNQWDALRAATEKIGVVAESQILVRTRGLEPPNPCGRRHLKALRFPVSPRPHNFVNSVPERRIELRSNALQASALPLSYSGILAFCKYGNPTRLS